ncbi:hypothetical protein ABPG72_021440 [Tetrahymena utriculariae]
MEIYHGVNNIVKIGKDLIRTYIKYLENQSYVTSKTGRRYYIIGFEAMINENKSKVEKYKYFFFDKGEVIKKQRLRDYDDLILFFKFANQWFVTLWKIHENEIYLADYKINSEDKFGHVVQIVKDFYKKFFDFQMPGKGIVILPDNFSYKVQESKNDDCGDLCMAFLYFYVIGSLIIEIQLTPPKRANFAISFGWLLLKIYHEKEYNFKKNINKPQTILLQVSKQIPSQSNLDEEMQQRDLQELEEGFGFREIFMRDGINKLPKKEKDGVENKVIRKTPIPNKENFPVSEETIEMNEQSDEEFRRKIVLVASQKDREELEENYNRQRSKNYQTKQILNSLEIEPYKFNNRSTAQDQIIQEKPAFNQQERRSASNKLNQDSFQLKPENIWQNLQSQPEQLEQSSIRKRVENKNQLQKTGDQILSQSSYFSSNQMSQYQKSPAVQQVQDQNQQQSKKIAQLSKQEFEKQKKELEDKLIQINNQFIKKQDIIDILDEIRKDVNLEMKIEMRKLAQDIKVEQEKKAIEDELRKKHFEDYFKFLLAYYYENDIQQYYQLLEEYNNRLRQFTVSNLPDHLFVQQGNKPQMNNISSLSTVGQTLPYYGSSNISTHHTPQQGHKSDEQLYEGFFNRGSMKYASSLAARPQAWNIEPKYLDNDNNFNKGNLKVPKNAEFSSPGFNGFAITTEKAEKYKNRIQKYLFDDLQFGQARIDQLKEIRRKQGQIEKLKQDQIEDLSRINDRGLKLFGDEYHKQQKINNQIEQERKYQQLILNPNGQQQNQRKNQLISKYNSQTNLQTLYNMNQDLYTSKTNNNANTQSSGYKTFVPTSNSIKITNSSNQNF